ncbi:hypothetical protein AcV5_006171 [Taiwanofungus camphoratus]|nr:hypothetical protein AcV5_006171 [Antrodia cinnamomea]
MTAQVVRRSKCDFDTQLEFKVWPWALVMMQIDNHGTAPSKCTSMHGYFSRALADRRRMMQRVLSYVHTLSLFEGHGQKVDERQSRSEDSSK